MNAKEYVEISQRKPKARWVPNEHEGVYSEMEMDFWLNDLQAFIERNLSSKQKNITLTEEQTE
ncbi:hypothetical protein KKE60_07570 [Patescibacteria group bacterium]|nr:hypothetical protein [Patescibacteria group bacterium]